LPLLIKATDGINDNGRTDIPVRPAQRTDRNVRPTWIDNFCRSPARIRCTTQPVKSQLQKPPGTSGVDLFAGVGKLNPSAASMNLFSVAIVECKQRRMQKSVMFALSSLPVARFQENEKNVNFSVEFGRQICFFNDILSKNRELFISIFSEERGEIHGYDFSQKSVYAH
jgi:hypothetical protein